MQTPYKQANYNNLTRSEQIIYIKKEDKECQDLINQLHSKKKEDPKEKELNILFNKKFNLGNQDKTYEKKEMIYDSNYQRGYEDNRNYIGNNYYNNSGGKSREGYRGNYQGNQNQFNKDEFLI